MIVSRCSGRLLGALLTLGIIAAPLFARVDAQEIVVAQANAKRTKQATGAPPSTEQRRKEAINSWTVGLAAGRTEGAPLQFASELARVVDDGDNMRVLPIVTRGIFDNVFDLLYLRGVDAAIVYGDVLEHFKTNAEIAGIAKRINYLMSLFPSELHIFAGPGINSIEDLKGKTVNFNTVGTAAAYSGPIILKKLGIDVDEQFIPHSEAMASMRKGENRFAATVWVSSKPLAPFLKGKFPEGYKFLPVQYDEKLEYYLPAYLESKDYPALIPEGQRIETIAVPAVLAVYDWPRDTDRFHRVSRLVDYIHDRLPRLQNEPGYHPKWKDVNLAAKVPGWTRFQPMQDKLDQIVRAPTQAAARPKIDHALARAQAARAAPDDPQEQERLFQQFMEWTKKRQN
ncbi:MAG TPA: TAXI family TRAP transporter solute-binding subunit [Hyphomicrobiaceae bacterium]|nr:TAXI family TRAP transporter solute-binding subunit [Hyphomicrobiaceae bacterium]